MVLLTILAIVFAGVALMVLFGEKYGKPLDVEKQRKYSKVIMILVFVLLIGALIKNMLG